MTHAGYLRSDTVSYVSPHSGYTGGCRGGRRGTQLEGNIVTQTNTVTQHKTLHFTASTGLPGAPTLQMTLIYDTEKRTLGGTGVITQAVAPPGGRIDVQGIHGEVTDLKAGFRLHHRSGLMHGAAGDGDFRLFLPPSS